jgi:hypothetical protein
VPPRAVLDDIMQYAERGEFTKSERFLDELDSKDAPYSDFCDRIRSSMRRYDDERIIDYIKSKNQEA